MNLRLLHAFVMLAEKENYADAADALAISQPALTKQINLLESLLNVALFSRGRQGTRLTTGGQLLLPEAKKVLKQNAVFLQHAAQVAKGGEGVIAAGFGLSGFIFAPQCIARFRAEYPGVEFRLEDYLLRSNTTCCTAGNCRWDLSACRRPRRSVIRCCLKIIWCWLRRKIT